MRLAIAAFTAAGEQLANQLCGELSQQGLACTVTALYGKAPHPELAEWTEEMFHQMDGLVFVGACGIAVRAVAPFLRGKQNDPAVIAVDEQGRFAIPLVSGHLGGANRLARQIAECLQAVPVITTATDLNERFAVDDWAVCQGLQLEELPIAKQISAALLAGDAVGFESDFPISGTVPEGILLGDTTLPLGICLSLDTRKQPFLKTLHLYPRIVTLGIGCRKGVGTERIRLAAVHCLKRAGICLRSVRGVATIDRKGQEAGLLQFCKEQGIPLWTAEPEQLKQVEGVFHSSGFVQQVTGVDNVCERAAVLYGGGLLLPKYVEDGVTVAAAVCEWHGAWGKEERK